MTTPLPASPDGHPELAVAFALRGLEPAEESAFVEHLPQCEPCRDIVDGTGEVSALLGTAVRSVDPPAGLRARILAAAEAESGAESGTERGHDDDAVTEVFGRPLPSSVTPDPDEPAQPAELPTDPFAALPSPAPSSAPADRERRVGRLGGRPPGTGRRSARYRRVVAGIAVAATIAAVATVGGLTAANRSLAEQRDAASAQAAADAQVVRMVDAASRPGTPHAVLTTPSGGFVGLVADRGAGPEVMLTGLAPNDGDHTYVLWGLAGGTPVGLDAFDMSDPGPIVQSVPSGSERFSAFAVSIEPGRAVPATPTQVLAGGQLQS